MIEENSQAPAGLTGIGLRLFFFFLLEIVAMVVFGTFLDELFGRLAAGAMGVFLAAVIANFLTVRIYERGRLEDVGMGWGHGASRHLLLGAAAGVVAGLLVTGALLTLGLAVWKPEANGGFQLGRLLWVSVLLLFGAVGEELLFRGYGFQLLLTAAGPKWIIPISAVIFGWAHHDNIAASPLGLVNTALWGLLLGYAFFRPGDLWLPIGLHFGWNWILPLLGANLSGFTLSLSGYNMEARGQEMWSGGAYGPEASLFTTGIAVALGLWLWKARSGGVSAPEAQPERRHEAMRYTISALLCFSSIVAFGQTPAWKEDQARKLTDEEKIELLRGLSAEYATVKAYLPRAKKALKVNSDGTWDKSEWRDIGDEYGPVARVGDLVQITKVDIDSERIVLQINGGLNTSGKWYEKIEGGIGSGTVPMSRNQTRSAGTTIAVVFPGKIPPVKAAEIKKILAQLLDFEKRSATENYFDTLPPEIQAAIKAKRAEIGMNRDQVKMAMGQPRDRIRQQNDGLETEDWIYGYPPGKITFVTFANGKVNKVKDSYAGLGGSTAPQPKSQQ